VYAALLGLTHLLVVAHFSRREYGLAWVGSARDEPCRPMGGAGGRLERAYRNWLETWPIFIAAVAAVELSGGGDAWSGWGAIAYLWGRLVYVPLYVIGVPVIRGLVWNVPTLGIMAMFAALFIGG
ncbi:MAG: MAPEG family protein, partial [Pseudomonadota bacterium]|nr:MAPEG family protein [Pseudomonadota bacterium]